MLLFQELNPFRPGIDVLKLTRFRDWPNFSLQHSNNIDNSARTGIKRFCHLKGAFLAVNRTERLDSAAHSRYNTLHFRLGALRKIVDLLKQASGHARHVAGNNEIPGAGHFSTQRGLYSRKRALVPALIRNHPIPQIAIEGGVANQENRIHNLAQFASNILCQSTTVIGQAGLVRTHSGAFPAGQNKAADARAPIHQEMISLINVTRRPRFAPCFPVAFLLAGSLSLSAATMGTRTTLVVKTDARTGRLVRSVVVTPRPALLALSVSKEDQAAPRTNEIMSGTISDIIDAVAERNQVEAPLVHSVIKAESNYNPAALSPKGAQGLMQLIPSTARRFGVSNSFDIQQNIEGGVRYLKFLMELYNNDYPKVIAAYNAGEGAVAKYGGIPPYSETINYVYRVGKNLKAARQFADIKAAERKAKVQSLQAQTVKNGDEPHSIQAVTGDDGRIYYKTQ